MQFKQVLLWHKFHCLFFFLGKKLTDSSGSSNYLGPCGRNHTLVMVRRQTEESYSILYSSWYSGNCSSSPGLLPFLQALSLRSWNMMKLTYGSVEIAYFQHVPTLLSFLKLNTLLKRRTFSIICLAAAVAKSLQSCPTLCDPMHYQPTRLLHPWDFPGKSTGVGCHCLLRSSTLVTL